MIQLNLTRPRIAQGRIRKVPLVLQFEAVECGAASLSMILRYYGKFLPLGEIRTGCSVTRDGSNLKNLKLYASSLGLDGVGKRIGPKQLANQPDSFFPCICFWRYCHFLVCEGVSPDGKFHIADPAGGKYTLSAEDFARSFSSIVISFSPTPEFSKSGKKESELLNFIPYLLSYKSPFLYCIILSLFLLIPSLAIPGMSGVFVNDFLQNKRYNLGVPIIWLSFGMVALNFFMKRYEKLIFRRVLLSLQRRLSLQISKKLFSNDYNFFLTRFAGDIAGRLLIGLQASESIVNDLITLLFGIFGALLILPFVALISWQLTIFSLAFVASNIFMSYKVSSMLVDTNKSLEIEQGKMGGISVRILTDIETVKSSGLEQSYLSSWQDVFAIVQQKTQSTGLSMAAFSSASQAIFSLYSYGTITLSGLLVMTGQMNLAGFIAFQALRSEFIQPLLGLGTAVSQLQQTEATLGRLTDLFSVKEDPKVRSLAALPDFKRIKTTKESETVGPEQNIVLPSYFNLKEENLRKNLYSSSLEVGNLNMSFSPIKPPFIREINFSLPAGSMLTIVGDSGCGKSTLIKLLTGLLTQTSGSIKYDGSEWLDFEDVAIRNAVGYVSQDVVGLRDTIENNIRLFRDAFSLDEVRRAAKIAELDSFILNLPNSYSTALGDGGSGLSGGQLQRLEIARAILKKPMFLFLDEATSALDIPTEKKVYENLRALGITIVSVAHRLISAQMSDFVLSMDSGRQVEFGTPSELLSSNGVFHKLIQADKS
jgi:ABC-type bacteriocin/lantibiotic exporter with double-glycine peptidase domain